MQKFQVTERLEPNFMQRPQNDLAGPAAVNSSLPTLTRHLERARAFGFAKKPWADGASGKVQGANNNGCMTGHAFILWIKRPFEWTGSQAGLHGPLKGF